jgi:hypothetical protein
MSLRRNFIVRQNPRLSLYCENSAERAIIASAAGFWYCAERYLTL